jgi:hypothetical protein
MNMFREFKELWQYATHDLTPKELKWGAFWIVFAIIVLSFNCSCTNNNRPASDEVELNLDIHEVNFENHTYLVWLNDGNVVGICHDVECEKCK